MIRMMLNPVIAEASINIAKAADFEISEAEHKPFVDFVHWINSRPEFIKKWRSDVVTEQREYIRFMGLSDDVREAYAAAAYHQTRVAEIELSVRNVLDKCEFSNILAKGSVCSFGRMRQMDYEYQAYVLSYRRCLDYFAWSITTYFNHKIDSFNRLSTSLNGCTPIAVSAPLLAAYQRHIQNFSFVIGSDKGRSTRDKIAHQKSVKAGFINAFHSGYRIVGGGEGIGIVNPNDERDLSQRLADRLKQLHDCLADMLLTFQQAVTKSEIESHIQIV